MKVKLICDTMVYVRLKGGVAMRGGFGFDQGPVVVGDGIKKYMTLVYNRMFMALCVTGLVSFICTSNQEVLAFLFGGFSTVLMLATIGIVFYLSARIGKINSEAANALFWLYSALIGVSISPMISLYTGESVTVSFFTAAVFFGGMSFYGYVTKKDLSGVGSFMMVGLFAIIITSLINLALGSSAIQMGLSAFGVIVFCGLTAYDIQKIKKFYDANVDEETLKKRAVIGALGLYLDFLNIFISLLRLLGDRR
ncbi:MAG: Bax inhibitor-1/YccA family protein [Holosporales bacterium]|nr:Bax inhibitor-1/YccA family protein [Holosporales bacterium]